KSRSRRGTQHPAPRVFGVLLQMAFLGRVLLCIFNWGTQRGESLFFRESGLSVAHNRAADGRYFAARADLESGRSARRSKHFQYEPRARAREPAAASTSR